MATDLEKLVVQLSADIKGFENGFKKAKAATDRQTRAIIKQHADAQKKIDTIWSGVGTSITRGLGALGLGFGTAQSVRAVTAASAEYVSLKNALRVTGLEGEKLESTLGNLFQIAQKNGTALGPLTTLYSRAAQAQGELKASSAELLEFTDGISLALRVAGTDSQQASGALLQLSQALGSGTVRAEEFNSVNEGARPILQAVAAGLKEAGGSVSTLKNLVNEGKISSEAFFRAFLAGMPLLQDQARKAQGTVGQAVERMSNAFTLFIGKLDETTGASKNAAENINGVSAAIEKMPAYIQAAADGLDALQKKLGEIGNMSVFDKLNKMMGVDYEFNNARFAGDTATMNRIRLQRAEKDLADAINTANQTGLDVDRKRVEAIERQLVALRQAATLTSRSVLGGRMAEGANDPLGRAPAPASIKPVSIKDYAVTGKDKKSSNTVGVDSFERAVAAAQKRIEVQKAEIAVIDQGVAARERAKLVAELETAAKAANTAAGMKNAEVTAKQRVTIDQMADAMFRSAQAAEAANSPLRAYAREAADVNKALENAAVSGLREFEDSLMSVIDGTKSAEEAFKAMTASILNDIARMVIRMTVLGPLAKGLGGLFGLADGGPVGGLPNIGNGHGLYATGGYVSGPGSSRSDSIPARLSNGEYVINAKATAQNRALLDAINSGRMPKFAEGGFVGSAPRLPNLRGGGGMSVNAPVSVAIDARGADREGLSRVEEQVAKLKAELPSRIVNTVRDAKSRRAL